jgi:hypothetical protein
MYWFAAGGMLHQLQEGCEARHQGLAALLAVLLPMKDVIGYSDRSSAH